MSSFDARTTRERNGEMISRGEAMSPFDAPAPFFPGGDVTFRRAGPGFFRAAARGWYFEIQSTKLHWRPEWISPSGVWLAGTGRRWTGRELFAGKSGNRLDGMHRRSILRTSTEESTEELFLALPDGPSAISGA